LATHKSAEKRMRQNETRRVRNRHVKTSIKTMVKKVREAVQEKNEAKAGQYHGSEILRGEGAPLP
jgi:small subunit ribosomal protein S20